MSHYCAKTPLRTMLETMGDERASALVAIYDKYKDLFHYAKGSGHNHQAWEGGYADHIAECIRINWLTHEALSQLRPLPFTVDSASICLFLHDIEKPFRYAPEGHPEAEWFRSRVELFKSVGERAFQRPEMVEAYAWERAKGQILDSLQPEFDFTLTPEEHNALKYTHGEGDDHQKDRRVAGPLAAHVHHCDNTSARIWFDEGQGLG